MLPASGIFEAFVRRKIGYPIKDTCQTKRKAWRSDPLLRAEDNSHPLRQKSLADSISWKRFGYIVDGLRGYKGSGLQARELAQQRRIPVVTPARLTTVHWMDNQ
jgi:hypothetical protein